MNRKLLGIYLNDHLAGSTAGVELARRAAGSNEGNELRSVPGRCSPGRSRRTATSLKDIMRRLEYGEDIPKKVGAWTFEKIGRLKPNGQLTGYSPLSRVVELEGLALGITGKLALWKSLQEIVDEEPRLDAAELARLARARRAPAATTSRSHRLRAVREAFRG